MARPTKQGLDYFPLDVTTDDKLELIEAKHGLIGFGIVIKLYQRIYKEGYYTDWNDERVLIFKKSVNVDINIITEVINDAIKYNIFNEELFNKYHILTSTGIQKRFLSACDRRKTVELDRNYIIVNINQVNANINWINDLNSTQSKVKESKVKESSNGKTLNSTLTPVPFPKNTPKPNELTYEQTVQSFTNDQARMEQIAMEFHCKLETVTKYADTWLKELNLKGQFPRDIRDTNRYFYNSFKIYAEERRRIKKQNESSPNV